MAPHVLLIGGHGKISLFLTPLLLQKAWTVTSLIRSAAHKPDILAAAGSRASDLSVKIHDLESVDSQNDAQAVIDETKPDYIVFSAGAGGKPPVSRTYTIDRDACIHFINAAASTPSVTKFLLVSYIGSRRSRAPWWTDEDWAATQEINNGALKDYHIAKLAADEALVAVGKGRGEGWAGWCLRPGTLSEENAGGVKLGKIGARGKIGRGKVADLAAALLASEGKGGWVDCLDGDEAVDGAITAVVREGVDCRDGEE